MRRAFAIALGFLASALIIVGAGCTFLVSFNDVPKESGGPDVVTQPTADVTPPVDGSLACDPEFPLASIKGCGALQENAKICADDSRITYPAGRDASTDVVTCSKRDGGVAVCVKHCSGAGGCASLPEGFPDQCDPCAYKAEGVHCGSEMAEWQPENAKLLIGCNGGRMTTVDICDAGCNRNDGGGNARCN